MLPAAGLSAKLLPAGFLPRAAHIQIKMISCQLISYILYTDSTHIKAKANKHRKALVTVEETPKEYIEELNAQIDLDRKILEKKPFNHDDDDNPPKGGGGKTQMKSLTDPESGQQNRDGKPDGFHYLLSGTYHCFLNKEQLPQ